MRDNSKRLDCLNCGRLREEDERFSWRGKCPECSRTLLIEGMESNIFTDPKHTLSYRKGVAASVNAILMEDLPELFEEYIKTRAEREDNA